MFIHVYDSEHVLQDWCTIILRNGLTLYITWPVHIIMLGRILAENNYCNEVTAAKQGVYNMHNMHCIYLEHTD